VLRLHSSALCLGSGRIPSSCGRPPISIAPLWCNVVQWFADFPGDSVAIIAKVPAPAKEGTRASVTFPADLYSELERIAEEKKVSVAWVVRDAAEKYVEAQYPLFRRQ